MPGEVPSDVPPAAFGRFRVLHQIGSGSLGPVFRGEDPDTRQAVAIKQLRLNLPPARARQVADELRSLVGRVPDHPSLARVLDAGLYEVDPYVVTSFSAGESLDVALHEYGPAAIVDALPRLRGLADGLDRAAAIGVWHGALQPRDIIVSADDTQLSGLGIAPVLERAGVGRPLQRPYEAPEVAQGQPSSPASDQFSLAAIAHEWLFGRRASIDETGDSGPAPSLDIPALPGVDRDVLESALASALATDPADRFPSSVAFVAAMESALHRHREPFAAASVIAEDTPSAADADFVLADLPLDNEVQSPVLEWSEPAESTEVDAIAIENPVAWRGSLAAAPEEPTRYQSPRGFGHFTVAAALVSGLFVGAVGGYLLATARAMKGEQADTRRTMPTDNAAAGASRSATPEREFTDTPVAASPRGSSTAVAPPTPATPAPLADAAAPATASAPRTADVVPAARAATARLLVRSTPPGANVVVDGTPRGVTPLALRELELGTRTVVISRPGYTAVERQITLTADRPSRSVDVALTAARGAVTSKPAPAAASSGSLVVDSIPRGATVTVDGKAAGTTPLTLASVSPGPHTVRLERAGYRASTTTIDVKAGARARVAARLVGGQEQE